MKFSHILMANLFRKKTRLVLTTAMFAIALLLFGVLAIINIAFTGGVDVAGVDRLVVTNRTSIIQPLPLAYRDRVLRIPGVKDVSHFNWFGGVYQDPKNFFGQFAIDVDHQRQLFPEFKVPDEQWQNFIKDRTGAIAGAGLVKRFGWKVGDRIPIQGTFLPGTWEFTLDGVYQISGKVGDENQFWFQWDYFEEKVPDRYKGMVGWYYVKVANPDDSAQVAKAIDNEFLNSTYETHSDTEKAFAAGWVRQLGNIRLIIMIIGAIVFFTLLLVTGNTMATAVRERTSELGIFKALGFPDRVVLSLVVGESLLIACVGGAFGLGLAKLFTLPGDPTGGFLPIFYLPARVIPWGFASAFGVGIASAFFPAIRAKRLRVVDALRRV
ncbi:MAG TPA: FtsX-like permease family protein [Candidatus Angelobacter sp.]